MNQEKFIKLIKSIGFLSDDKSNAYYYKDFRINLFSNNYDLCVGNYILYAREFKELDILDEYFKKELRAIKLKELLK